MSRSDPDQLARELARMALMARHMAPSWDGAGISIPICSPSMGTIGRALPGRGIALVEDLKNIGINRPIPYIYEPSAIGWMLDVFRDSPFQKAEAAWRVAQRRHRATPMSFVRDPERGAITGLDGIADARLQGKGEDRQINKASITTVANTWSSLWRAGGTDPVAGVYTNTPGRAPDRTSVGAWSLGLTNPTAPDKKYLLSFTYSCSVAIQQLMVVDLLCEVGGLTATPTGNKTVSSAALTRYTDGKGVRVVGVVATALGTGTGAMSMNSYTDQDGNTGQAGQTFNSAASTIINRTIPNSTPFIGTDIPLASGDYGVRAISTINVATAHSAGVIALEMYFPLLWLPGVVANLPIEKPAHLGLIGLNELVTTSGGVLGCLSGYVMPSTTASGILTGRLITVAG